MTTLYKYLLYALAFLRSLVLPGLQKTGTSFTTSDDPDNCKPVTVPEDTGLGHAQYNISLTVRIYPCGNLPVPKLYVVRDTDSGESVTLDARTVTLLFTKKG